MAPAMIDSPQIPDFDLVEQSLHEAGGAMDPSEAHGLLCAMLCTTGTELQGWLDQVVDPGAKGDETLDALHQGTIHQLNDPELSFRLLLPGDEIPLADRAVALRRWVHGFLFGIGLGGIKQDALPSDVYDFLRDLLEVAKVDFDIDADAGEADEEAFMEISEFVRLGVLSFSEALQPTVRLDNATTH